MQIPRQEAGVDKRRRQQHCDGGHDEEEGDDEQSPGQVLAQPRRHENHEDDCADGGVIRLDQLATRNWYVFPSLSNKTIGHDAYGRLRLGRLLSTSNTS